MYLFPPGRNPPPSLRPPQNVIPLPTESSALGNLLTVSIIALVLVAAGGGTYYCYNCSNKLDSDDFPQDKIDDEEEKKKEEEGGITTTDTKNASIAIENKQKSSIVVSKHSSFVSNWVKSKKLKVKEGRPKQRALSSVVITENVPENRTQMQSVNSQAKLLSSLVKVKAKKQILKKKMASNLEPKKSELSSVLKSKMTIIKSVKRYKSALKFGVPKLPPVAALRTPSSVLPSPSSLAGSATPSSTTTTTTPTTSQVSAIRNEQQRQEQAHQPKQQHQRTVSSTIPSSAAPSADGQSLPPSKVLSLRNEQHQQTNQRTGSSIIPVSAPSSSALASATEVQKPFPPPVSTANAVLMKSTLQQVATNYPPLPSLATSSGISSGSSAATTTVPITDQFHQPFLAPISSANSPKNIKSFTNSRRSASDVNSRRSASSSSP